MLNLATSSLAPVLGQRVPLRGPARLLYRSYAKTSGRPGGSERRLTAKFGDQFDVDLSSFLEWQLWAFGSYEEHVAEVFEYLIGPADRCIDVGANIGIHTIRLARLVGPRGSVIALEPDPELARRNSDNLLLNRLENVRLIQAAASERSGGSAVLFRPGAHDLNKARASLLPHAYLTGSAVTVPTLRLDDVSDGPVALIKIDVEGHEAAVVAGAVRTIEAYSPAIIFEYDPELLNDRSDSPFCRLRDSGYRLFSFGKARHSVTGRGSLELRSLTALPDDFADILAVSGAAAGRVSSLAR
ncbi:MAG TPA: FkbM family methyltransferase [Streptosporangiaceae bacterium]|nr:FkbM family methyltransferase [Streptosporangiaceae bacterium]